MKNILFLLAALVIFVACTKTITPNLNTTAQQFYIQGAVSDTMGPYYVSIVNSVGFYDSSIYPGVSGATVTITDSTSGLRDALTETNTGLYVTHSLIQGIPGHTYLLNVLLNGKTYTASSTMPQPVTLDSVTFDLSDPKQILAVANYQDPPGIVNFYKYTMTINGTVDKRFLTFEDRLSDGRYIRDNIDADTGEVKKNDFVRLSLVGIDKNVYTFLHEAEQIAYNNAGLVAPANPQSNISGGCLGYFSAQTVSSKINIVRF
ncbi:MAG: DUF4249 domain-containing protein [Chitinophagaceae bacterium]|nr:DUF4249 domain-containing protein [Chitinophagaceae bacterium]